MHELEHVALDPQPKQWKARLARFTEQLGSFVVERAQDLHLIALPDRLEAVVGEDGAEVRPTGEDP